MPAKGNAKRNGAQPRPGTTQAADQISETTSPRAECLVFCVRSSLPRFIPAAYLILALDTATGLPLPSYCHLLVPLTPATACLSQLWRVAGVPLPAAWYWFSTTRVERAGAWGTTVQHRELFIYRGEQAHGHTLCCTHPLQKITVCLLPPLATAFVTSSHAVHYSKGIPVAVIFTRSKDIPPRPQVTLGFPPRG